MATRTQAGDAPYVSTGHLPSPDLIKALVAEAHERYKSNADGQNSQVYPALARVPSNLFGICVVGTSGNVYAVGDSDHEFSIMSVSKPFVFALVCEALGHEQVREKIGVNATGRGVQLARGRRARRRRSDESDGEFRGDRDDQPGAGRDARRTSGSSSTTGCRGSPAVRCRSTTRCTRPPRKPTTAIRALPGCFRASTAIYLDPAEAIDLYTKQCSLNVSAKDLAVMGATLADGGVNPHHQGARG